MISIRNDYRSLHEWSSRSRVSVRGAGYNYSRSFLYSIPAAGSGRYGLCYSRIRYRHGRIRYWDSSQGRWLTQGRTATGTWVGMGSRVRAGSEDW